MIGLTENQLRAAMLRPEVLKKGGSVAQTIAGSDRAAFSRWPLKGSSCLPYLKPGLFRHQISAGTDRPHWARQLWAMFRRDPRLKLVRYGVSGVAISVGYTASVVLLVEFCGWTMPALASAASFVIWTPVSYFVHRNFTFRFAGGQTAASIKFGLAFLARLAASAYTVHLAAETFGSSYLIGVLTNWFLLPLINYTVMNFWVFRSRVIAGVSSPL